MTRKMCCTAVLCLWLIPITGFAAQFDISLGAWNYGIDGNVSNDSGRIDLFEQKEPGLDLQFSTRLPFEFLREPLLRGQYLDVAARSDERVNDSQEIFGVDVVAGNSELDLDVDVEFWDLFLIWQWGEALRLNAGGGVKVVDARADVTVVTTVTSTPPLLPPTTSQQTDEADEDFGFVIPALFLGGEYSLRDWIALQAEVNGLGDGDNRFVAGQVVARITPWQRIGVDIGWRLIDIEGEAGGDRLDVQADGPFLSAVVRFGGE